MAVMIFHMGSSKTWIIIIDAKQSCDQVMIREYDIEKLAFFAPNHENIYLM